MCPYGEGRTRAFEAALNELRGYAQDRDTSHLLVATQMIYEEPNSPLPTDQRRSGACPRSIYAGSLPRQHRDGRGPSSFFSLPIFLLFLNVRNHSFKT
jgi:hypothetical protein